MTATGSTRQWCAVAITVAVLIAVAGCTSESGAAVSTSGQSSTSPAVGHSDAISSRTLVDAQWGSGAADWQSFTVQAGTRIGPSLFADPAHHILYVTDPAHEKLRSYDDRTGEESESYEASIPLGSLEGATSPASGDAYVLDWMGVLQRIAGGRAVATVKVTMPEGVVWGLSGPLAVTTDETVWLHSFRGWHAVARGSEALLGGASGGVQPTTEARLTGNRLVLGSGTAERSVALPASALPLPTKTPLPDAVTVTWTARSADSGVVWAVVTDLSRRTSTHLTLIEVTPAGNVRSTELPPPPGWRSRAVRAHQHRRSGA